LNPLKRFLAISVIVLYVNSNTEFHEVLRLPLLVEHFTEQDDRDEMSVNFNGPMELIRLVLPKMREKRDGRIISISSVGGMMAMPTIWADCSRAVSANTT
jgi:NAD(P)-dependent dehydrogenase (short-subunit alcohol dehydrogenase family)